MLCTACGHDNREGRRFCAQCGAELTLACASCGAAYQHGERFCGQCGGPLAGSPTTQGEASLAPTATTAAQPPRARQAAPLPDAFADGRYQVKGFLGEGGRKRVYLAHDARLDRDVAVAVIKTEGLDEAGLDRVRREAQAMGRLGDHPHIVTVHDIGEDSGSDGRGQPYIVSQYMAGGDLEGLIRQAENHRLPIEEALRIATQLCQALEHAHTRGVIHRDLKPGNVWLTDPSVGSGQAQAAKLGDFGLAVAIDRSRLTMAGTMVGTASYMPPEQALGGEVDARSDLYSLGCVLYEMVTGRPPFIGDDTVGIISQHINTPPLAPSWHNPQAPPALESLILRLLAKSPDQRPASAGEVIAALDSIASAPAEVVPVDEAPRPQAGAAGFRRSRFVGRDKELGQLKDRLEAAMSGRGALVMVVGEPGIGKTRLSDELSVYARLRGGQVLLGQCYESEGAPPYIPFVEALRQYVNSRPPDALREELGDGGSDVAKLVSEVRARVPDLPPSSPQEPEAERYRLLEAVTSFLVNASRANPLLLILDDIHWADKPSLLLLQHLARRLADSRILVVGAYRDIELDRRHPLSEVVAQLRRERLHERILLRGLDTDGVHALLAARAEHDVPRQFAQTLHQQTEGNPFFIEEIIFHLVDTGAISRQEGRWVGDPTLIAENIPEGVREVIGRRLSRLREDTNQALTFASVLGREFDFDVLTLLAEMDEETLLSSLEEALAAQLIEERRGAGGAAYRFSHALVEETLYGELSIARKQRFHLRAGRALEQARAGRLEPYVGQLAYHFHQGNDAAKAIDYSRQAADAAVRVYAWEDAIRHWQTALELMEEQGGDESELAQLLERLGDVTYLSGIDFEKGALYLEKALAIYERMGARGKVAAMHSRLGRAMVSFSTRGMDLPNGIAHLEAARAILEKDAPQSPGLAYVRLGLASACLYTREVDKCEAHARRALEIGETIGSRPVVANALAFVGWATAAVGRLREGLDHLERAYDIAEEENLTFVSFLAASFLAGYGGFSRRDPAEGLRLARREMEKPQVAAAPMLRGAWQSMAAQCWLWAGQMDEARESGGEPGMFGGGPDRLLPIAEGEWESLESSLLKARDAGASSGNAAQQRGATHLLGELYFLWRRYDESEKHLREGVEADKKAGIRAFGGLRNPMMLARLLARTGRPDEAQQHVDFCQEALAGGDDWGGTAGGVALAHAELLGAQGKWQEAEEAFDEAVAIVRKYGLPWDEADALESRARMYLTRDKKGDRQQALRLLDQTIAIYQRLGAKRHLELALGDKLAAQGVDTSEVQTSIDAVVAAVQSEHPDLRQHAAPDGTVTLLFSDIEGSTAINERLGDKRWLELLREHNAIVRQQVKAHGGFEVKSQGDGFMLAFQSGRRALECAIGIQRALAERNIGLGATGRSPLGAASSAPTAVEIRSADGNQEGEPGAGRSRTTPTQAEPGPREIEPIRVRIGLHTGEVIKEGDDFFGKHVNLAARIASQAQGGEILVSSLLKQLTDSSGEMEFGEGRELALKGLSGKHRVFPVAW